MQQRSQEPHLSTSTSPALSRTSTLDSTSFGCFCHTSAWPSCHSEDTILGQLDAAWSMADPCLQFRGRPQNSSASLHVLRRPYEASQRCILRARTLTSELLLCEYITESLTSCLSHSCEAHKQHTGCRCLCMLQSHTRSCAAGCNALVWVSCMLNLRT